MTLRRRIQQEQNESTPPPPITGKQSSAGKTDLGGSNISKGGDDASKRRYHLFLWLTISFVSFIVASFLGYHGLLHQTNNDDYGAHFEYVEEIPVPTTQSLANVTTEFAYYSRLKNDRSGSTIDHMLRSFGYAYLKRQSYMGACGKTRPNYMTSHKRLLEAIGLEEVLPFACPNETAINPNGVKSHMMFLWESREETLHQAAVENGWDDFDDWKIYLKDKVAAKLPPPNKSNPSETLIAVHIRRGDINPCCYHIRYLPNLYYHRIIESTLEKYPNNNVKVTIFSEEQSYESFDDFRSKNYTIVLGGDIGEVWRQMISSDVLIISQSGFSEVPQLLTRGIVANDPYNIPEPLQTEVLNENLKFRRTCGEVLCEGVKVG